MVRGLEILAAATLACGAMQILQYAARKRGRGEQREALQTWETEGGAVPASRTGTAAATPVRPMPAAATTP
jgi:hypothetical protein